MTLPSKLRPVLVKNKEQKIEHVKNNRVIGDHHLGSVGAALAEAAAAAAAAAKVAPPSECRPFLEDPPFLVDTLFLLSMSLNRSCELEADPAFDVPGNDGLAEAAKLSAAAAAASLLFESRLVLPL